MNFELEHAGNWIDRILIGNPDVSETVRFCLLCAAPSDDTGFFIPNRKYAEAFGQNMFVYGLCSRCHGLPDRERNELVENHFFAGAVLQMKNLKPN
jgi:hypothetical protein